jgi:hypothetical protein
MLEGRFRITVPRLGMIHYVRNRITELGDESFLKMITRADVVDVASGGNFYIGMCRGTDDKTNALSDVPNEPTVLNGYSRKAVARDATGWPTISKVNGIWRALSAAVSFTASGGNFDQAFNRVFLCNVSSGSAGLLLAYSGQLEEDFTLTPALSPITVEYELWMR